MYASIIGTVEEIDAGRVVLLAGHVGYELFCSANTTKKLTCSKEAKLLAHLNVTDDALTLYGFFDEAEKRMFRQLLSVTRVGPKLALSVLSHLTPDDVAAAVITDNAAAFDPVPGMGRKGAQRVILELKEKVGTMDVHSGGTPIAAATAGASNTDMMKEAVAALVGLGYDGNSASRAVTAAKDYTSVEELLTKALRSLAKG